MNKQVDARTEKANEKSLNVRAIRGDTKKSMNNIKRMKKQGENKPCFS